METQKVSVDERTPPVFEVDLHAHTRFFHGKRRLGDRFDPVGHRLLVTAAGLRGLDGVATTNHDYYRAFSGGSYSDGANSDGASSDGAFSDGEIADDEISDRASTACRVVTIPGIEISTDSGHVLVVGPDPPAETVPGVLSPAEAVERAHDRDCAAIIAHPFRKSTVREATDVPFDAVEINGKHPHTLTAVARVAAAFDLPIVGGSDAHFPFEVGRAYTRIDADELTPSSVVDAIQDGRVEYQIANGPVDRAIRRGYRLVHDRKHGSTDES